MAENNKANTGPAKPADRQRVGADLIIPVAGLSFGGYYLWSIVGLPAMAQFNGRFLVFLMVVLVVLLLIRIGWKLSRGEARVSFGDLAEEPKTAILRWGVFGLAVGFTLIIAYFGFTLSIFLFLLLSMVLLGVRPWTKLLSIAFGAAATGYLLFIVALGARLPRGPIELFLAGLFA